MVVVEVALKSFIANFDSNLAFISEASAAALPDENVAILNLGIKLSELLLEESPDKRKYSISNHIKSILSNIKRQCVLVDRIELLFNPEYDLDIVKLFARVARNKKIIVVWPGTIASDEMVYSEPQYDDYRKYSVSERDITILK